MSLAYTTDRSFTNVITPPVPPLSPYRPPRLPPVVLEGAYHLWAVVSLAIVFAPANGTADVGLSPCVPALWKESREGGCGGAAEGPGGHNRRDEAPLPP